MSVADGLFSNSLSEAFLSATRSTETPEKFRAKLKTLFDSGDGEAQKEVSLELLLYILAEVNVQEKYGEGAIEEHLCEEKLLKFLEAIMQRQTTISQARLDQAKTYLTKAIKDKFDKDPWESKQSMIRANCYDAHVLLGEFKADQHEHSWASMFYRVYYNSIRLRVTYWCFVTFVLSLSLLVGLLTETFMSTFTPFVVDGQKLMFFFYFWCLPLLVVFFAFFCEGVLMMAIDAANAVPLVKFASSLLHGLRFFTWPRFVIWLIWVTTSGVGCLQVAGVQLDRLPKFVILVVLIVVEVVALGFSKAWEEWNDKGHRSKLLSFLFGLHFIVTVYFLIWCRGGQVFSAQIMGLLSVPIMIMFKDRDDAVTENARKWQCIAIDVMFFFIFEILPAANAVVGMIVWRHASDGRGVLGALWRSYLWGAVCSICLAVVSLQCCNVYFAFLSSRFWRRMKKRCISEQLQRSKTQKWGLGKLRDIQRHLAHKMHKSYIAPGSLRKMHKILFDHVEFTDESGMIGVCAYEGEKRAPEEPRGVYMGSFASVVGVVLCSKLFLSYDFLKAVIVIVIIAAVVALMILVLRNLLPERRKVKKFLEDPWPVITPWVISAILWTFCVVLAACMPDPGVMVIFLCPTFLLMSATASSVAYHTLPGIFNRPFWMVSGFFWLAFAVLVFTTDLELPPFGASVSIVNKTDIRDRQQYLSDFGVQRDPSHQYALCQYRYGSGSNDSQLTALDVAQLAGMTYEHDCSDIEKRLAVVFDDQDSPQIPRKATVFYCDDYYDYPRMVVFDIGTTRVIAIKGTSTFKDAYTDATLYSAVKVLQWFEFVFPVIDLFPLDQLQWFLYRAHLNGQRDSEEKFWVKMTQHTKNFTKSEHITTVMLTGHSLGGTFAQVMAARLNLPALVWSAPGVKYSANRFGIRQVQYWNSWLTGRVNKPKTKDFGVQILKARVRNVIPDFDIVPRVDAQLSLVDHIECRGKYSRDSGNTLGDMSCHSLNRTACEVWRVCGDKHKRFFHCPYVGKHDINHVGKHNWEEPDDVF